MTIHEKLNRWFPKEPEESEKTSVENMQTELSPPMSDESFAEWLGVGRAKKEELAETTYFTCMKVMSESIAKMPWKFYQRTERGVIEAEDTDVSRLLKRRPNPLMTPTTFWATVEANRNHYGNAYVFIRSKTNRKRYGGEFKVLDLWVMPSDDVKVLVDDAGYFQNTGKIWYEYNDRYSGKLYVFSTDDVLHFKTAHSFNGITGLAVKDILTATVEGANESQEYLNNLYKNGLTGKAALEYTGDLSPGHKRKLLDAFQEYASGAQNAGRPIPVPQGMKLVPLDIKLSDSQFIELKKYSALQIAAAFGVKPNQINDYTKSSYSNSEMQQLSFLTDTMLFVLKQYEEEVNYKLLSDEEALDEGKYFKLNEKVLLRTDSKTQMEIFAMAVQNGIEKINECRRKLDLQDADGGDKLIVNGNYIPLTEVGKQYGTDQTEKTAEEDPKEVPEEQTEEAPEDPQEGGEDGDKQI